ncbi:MAG TPA: EI24 domain-containing protein [Saprospiraceae bacterium]|nr:EI24 domain-containing protein [Saprospiraceae bacterium]HRO07932.1 EI24 domain-containing protein [Saprospiraceae bacterium]HRP41427.1 EI24 domain-containing protein [Saprospiraceae bacterium]
MITQIFLMFRYFFTALGNTKGQAMKYILYTGLIALILVSLMIWGTWNFAPWFGGQLTNLIPWEWAKHTIFFTILTATGIAWFFWIGMKYVLLILAGPMLSLVSEKLEKQMGTYNGMSGFSFTASAARTVRINMRNMLKELSLTGVLFIGGLIPGLNIIVLILLFLVQSYFAGFGIMDFYLERHYTYRESVALVYKQKWAAIALGAIFTLLFLIPIVGVLVAPYLCTVAATHYFIDRDKKASPGPDIQSL